MSAHTYHGVTITLAGLTTEGSYVTGEPYIILAGATSLTAIDNPSNQDFGECLTIGGSMINPVPLGSHGFNIPYATNTTHPYDAAKNVGIALPVNVSPGDMLVVAVAKNDSVNFNLGAYKYVCFSFVSAAPPPGSLRPGFYGTDRSLAFTESDIHWEYLKTIARAGLAEVPGVAYMSDTTRFPALPWFSWGPGWESTVLMPLINTANSGNSNTAQFSAWRFALAAIWLNLDFTREEKRTCLLKIIQNGIDIASYFTYGGNFRVGGSHQMGYKFPLFLAAIMLESPTMLAISRNPNNFVEGNMTTWRINNSDLSRFYWYPDDAGTQYFFQESELGKYWWGFAHSFKPQDDRPNAVPVRNPYNDLYSYALAPMLWARLIGRAHDWGWSPAFHYFEQFLITFGTGAAGNLFQSYYNAVYPTLPPLVNETSPTPTTLRTSILEPGQSLALKPDPWGHPVRYTQGSSPADPTSGTGTAYTAPITGISASTTIKAKSFPADYQDPSATATIPVTIITNGTPAPPTNLQFIP